MSIPAVNVEHLSKRYRIGTNTGAYGRLTESLSGAVRTAARRARQRESNGELDRYIWALKDVSLEIAEGEVAGIIGRNGAGKTTLLKILSRITEPTEGYADLAGRVGSLLEVGTGFHPELTGRENISLNGAILGMRRAEIASKFDDIVEFAEVQRFLDTPVKRYSSGMYVRLAFAVAAHLEPEILIVDEVLAVGDAAFQKKCLGKMGDVAHSGRTVVFVSHNMVAVGSLCSRAWLLDGGRVVASGPTAPVVEKYLETVQTPDSQSLAEREDRGGDGTVRFVALRVEPADAPTPGVSSMSRLRVTFDYEGREPLKFPHFLASINDMSGVGLFLLDSDAAGGLPETLPPRGRVVCVTDPIHLTPGSCFVNVALRKGKSLADHVEHAATFTVEGEDFYGSGKIPARDWVMLLLRQEWRVEP